MPLKFKIGSPEEVNEAVRPFYIEQNGAYFLDVDGAVSRDKLNEFRDNNIQLTQKLKEYGDITPKTIEELQTEVNTLRNKKSGMTQEEVDNMLNDRVKSMRTDLEGKIKGYDNENKTLKSQLEVLVIDNTVRSAASNHKVLDTAIDDVVMRAKASFKMKDGVAKAYDDKGNVIFGKDGESPLTVQEWVKDLNKTAPHLFVQSTGGGANNQGSGGSGQKRENMTPMSKISQGLNNR